ncbi:pyruvate kinase [Clostridium sp. C8-1-8]|uniref:pyruvate kinase n=1 Tax=Clostridium sp. C8-1-8 TaxID=2698831 RepID=UPI00136F6F0E|nr:pyruvate kinase [Clostridium sp. C8-1-8]
MLTIATIGPKVRTRQDIKRIIGEGANSIRINFSHCDYDNVVEIIKYIKGSFPRVSIIGDIQGYKVRVGRCFDKVVKVTNDNILYFCSEDKYSDILEFWQHRNELLVPLNIKEQDLIECSVKTVFMKDGSMEFEVLSKQGGILQCRTVCGGVIRAEKGCNLPGLNRKSKEVNKKDFKDIKFCVDNKVDIIVYSYVYDEKDIDNFIGVVKDLNKEQRYTPRLWAKIETEKAINNIKLIASKVDGVVLGRGDLLPETNIYKMALYQHNFIRAMKNSSKDVIIATHVLDSLKEQEKPTVNEMNDIFYCIGGGVSGFMLTGETSIGIDPLNAIRVLRRATEFYSKVFKKS